jgi:two-component system, OmpR family, sensor kinase
VAVAAVVLAMSAAVILLDEHQQHVQADRISHHAWATADDVQDPPAGVWLVIAGNGDGRATTPGMPPGIRGRIDPRALPDGVTRLVRAGRELVVWTGTKGARRVSAVYDLSPREQEEHRLMISLAAASLLGIIGAAVVGLVIGVRAVRPLGRAMALQRRFVADASHELRTPLSVLQLRAQLLRRHLLPTEPTARIAELDRLVRDAKALGDVVNDLLLAAELEHSPHAGERIDVRAVAGEVVDSLQPLAGEKEVDLTLAGDTRDTVVQGSPAALRRAISSLVDNALAHTPAGGHVRVSVTGPDAEAVVAVQDDGEGLDPAQVSRLFERFARGTGNDQGRRFGLGLALVDEVARAHGGHLDIDGEPGRGASFVLRLPILTPDA